MGGPQKIILAVAMTLALGFGFLPGLMPDFPYKFERLHIFLFNLCAGGFVLLWFAQRMGRVTANLYAWLALSVAYAVSAFLEQYAVTLIEIVVHPELLSSAAMAFTEVTIAKAITNAIKNL